MSTPEQSLLGHTVTQYPTKYDPTLLFPIPRLPNRQAIEVLQPLPFYGYDLWNAWEISWLNNKGKPCVAIGTLVFPCESKNLIESKSLKLYLNSYNGTRFASIKAVEEQISADLSEKAEGHVIVTLYELAAFEKGTVDFVGISLDEQDIAIDNLEFSKKYLSCESSDEIVTEVLISDLLKSNCPVTNQPDWATIRISYTGQKLNHEGLLKFIISFRDHNEFHEQCVERIYQAINELCHPAQLTVEARYTRRGGLDINPLRTNNPKFMIKNPRLVRQ